MHEIYQQFITGLRLTTSLEYIAVFAGIASAWFNRRENILVYPIGLVSTVIYSYLSLKAHLYGEASVNLYYTIMSIYGWIWWTEKDIIRNEKKLHISFGTQRDWVHQIVFFSVFYIVIFTCLTWLKKEFTPDAIPWADAFASASAYTGMWLMARKKVERWLWWIVTNIASIPLYFVKGYVFTSVQFFVLLVLAVSGLMAWRKKAALSTEQQGAHD